MRADEEKRNLPSQQDITDALKLHSGRKSGNAASLALGHSSRKDKQASLQTGSPAAVDSVVAVLSQQQQKLQGLQQRLQLLENPTALGERQSLMPAPAVGDKGGISAFLDRVAAKIDSLDQQLQNIAQAPAMATTTAAVIDQGVDTVSADAPASSPPPRNNSRSGGGRVGAGRSDTRENMSNSRDTMRRAGSTDGFRRSSRRLGRDTCPSGGGSSVHTREFRQPSVHSAGQIPSHPAAEARSLEKGPSTAHFSSSTGSPQKRTHSSERLHVHLWQAPPPAGSQSPVHHSNSLSSSGGQHPMQFGSPVGEYCPRLYAECAPQSWGEPIVAGGWPGRSPWQDSNHAESMNSSFAHIHPHAGNISVTDMRSVSPPTSCWGGRPADSARSFSQATAMTGYNCHHHHCQGRVALSPEMPQPQPCAPSSFGLPPCTQLAVASCGPMDAAACEQQRSELDYAPGCAINQRAPPWSQPHSDIMRRGIGMHGEATPSFCSTPPQRLLAQGIHQHDQAFAGHRQHSFHASGAPVLDSWMEQESAVFTQCGQKAPQPRDCSTHYSEPTRAPGNGGAEVQHQQGAQLSRSHAGDDRCFQEGRDAFDNYTEDGWAGPPSSHGGRSVLVRETLRSTDWIPVAETPLRSGNFMGHHSPIGSRPAFCGVEPGSDAGQNSARQGRIGRPPVPRSVSGPPVTEGRASHTEAQPLQAQRPALHGSRPHGQALVRASSHSGRPSRAEFAPEPAEFVWEPSGNFGGYTEIDPDAAWAK